MKFLASFGDFRLSSAFSARKKKKDDHFAPAQLQVVNASSLCFRQDIICMSTCVRGSRKLFPFISSQRTYSSQRPSLTMSFHMCHCARTENGPTIWCSTIISKMTWKLVCGNSGYVYSTYVLLSNASEMQHVWTRYPRCICSNVANCMHVSLG